MTTAEMEQRWIGKFQENLGIIRKVAGWTTQELADELGVARQTVSNLETGKSPMTKLQYLALRTVFNTEIAGSENRDLAKVIKTLVDDPIEQELGSPASAVSSDEGASETADANIHMNRVANALEQTSNSRAAKPKRSISMTMQALAVITGALASGTAAGLLTYLIFPGGKSGK